jgi:hypothetical protein
MIVEERIAYKEFWNLISDNGRLASRLLLKAIGIGFLFNFCAMLFGIGFGLMANAFILFIFRMFSYWQPAYTIGVKIIGLKHVPTKLPKVRTPWYIYPILLLYLLPMIAMFYVGLDMVISGGFLNQNMIYWLIE